MVRPMRRANEPPTDVLERRPGTCRLARTDRAIDGPSADPLCAVLAGEAGAGAAASGERWPYGHLHAG